MTVNLTAEEARIVNTRAYEAVQKHPKRLGAFSALPMGEPEKAAEELEYSVKELKFPGALIPNHTNGEYYDSEKYWPVFQKAQELDVPIYLHPAYPTEALSDMRYKGNYSDSKALDLSAYGLGWHQEVALHFMRLYASGLFDRFPKLKLIIGHMGEMLPYQLDRMFVKLRWSVADEVIGRRSLREVWDNNLWITTAGMFSLSPMACLLRTTKVDRILYSVDYPFARNEDGLAFIEALQKSGMVTEQELDSIAYKNAEKLLGIKL